MKSAIRMPERSLPVSRVPLAGAQKGEDAAATRIAMDFALLAGSRDNAFALVHALREGVGVRLVASTKPGTTAIIPPTGRMTWHDVKMALMLARYALQRYGISHPAGDELQAALTGGEVTGPDGNVEALRGVLTLRALGMNWGRIAAERFRRPEITNRRRSPGRSLERVAKFLRP